MVILAAAAGLGVVALLAGMACWVLSVFDQASELRAAELHAILEQSTASTWHDGEWEEP